MFSVMVKWNEEISANHMLHGVANRRFLGPARRLVSSLLLMYTSRSILKSFFVAISRPVGNNLYKSFGKRDERTEGRQAEETNLALIFKYK